MNHYERSALNYFAANPINRMTERRRDPAWLAAQITASMTRILPVYQTQNFFVHDDHTRPLLLQPDEAAMLIETSEPIFLGELEGVTYFAVDIALDHAALPQLQASGVFRDLRSLFGAHFDPKLGAVLAFAKGMSYWHQRHRFCGDCGHPTKSSEGGFVRVCTNEGCAKQHFPRTDPAIIVLVQAGEKCLLARQPSWPAKRFSVIAGFVEPGESLEDAVVREVREETNIHVANVHYHSSQPWPFPASLMLGYMAEATSYDLHFADQELEAARWLSRQEMADQLRSGDLLLPPNVSISHRLIETWFNAGDLGTLRGLLDSVQ